MFEIRHEPSPRQIMRHQAWQLQQSALAQCREANRAIGSEANPTYGLSTGLNLLGRPTPESFTLPDDRPYAIFPSPAESRKMNGIVANRSWKPLGLDTSTVTIDAVRCESAPAVFAHMSHHCSLEDLVAIGDSFMCRDRMLRRCTYEQLEIFLNRCGRFVGRPEAIRALRLVRANTDSPAETRLRLLAMRFGLPCPQTDIIIAKEPREIRLDLGWAKYRVGLEYQGSHHRDQFDDDLYRANLIIVQGWKVLQVTNEMIRFSQSAHELFEYVAYLLRKAGMDVGHVPQQPMTVREISRKPAGRPHKG